MPSLVQQSLLHYLHVPDPELESIDKSSTPLQAFPEVLSDLFLLLLARVAWVFPLKLS